MSDKILAVHADMKCAQWRMDYVVRTAHLVQAWGYKTIVCEIEDHFPWESHPDLAHPDAPPKQELRDMVRDCRAAGVDVIPLMQSLGHLECVVGKPAYAHLREAPELATHVDATNEQSRTLLCDLYAEIIETFTPRTFFHLGGDETWHLGKSERVRPISERMGPGRLYLSHMLPLFDFVRSKGLRPMIWHDICFSHPQILSDVPKDVAMVHWEYSEGVGRQEQTRIWGGHDPETGAARNVRVAWGEEYDRYAGPEFREHLEPYAVDEETHRSGTFRPFYCTDVLKDHGFQTLTAGANRSGGDMVGIPQHSVHLPNAFGAARHGTTRGDGHLVTSWSVRHCHPETTHPATFAASLAVRTRDPWDREAALRAFAEDFFGAPLPELPDALAKAEARLSAGRATTLAGRAQRMAEQGMKFLPHVTEGLVKELGGQKQALARLTDLRREYAQARDAFAAMRAKAQRNAHNFDYWIEGVQVHALLVDFLGAALRGRLAEAGPALLERVAAAREETRRLFAETYVQGPSLDRELTVRYGFLETALNHAAPGS